MTLPPMSLQDSLRELHDHLNQRATQVGCEPLGSTSKLTDAAAELDRLQARVAELEVDAERYRWLRKSCDKDAPAIYSVAGDKADKWLSYEVADAAIDELRTKQAV